MPSSWSATRARTLEPPRTATKKKSPPCSSCSPFSSYAVIVNVASCRIVALVRPSPDTTQWAGDATLLLPLPLLLAAAPFATLPAGGADGGAGPGAAGSSLLLRTACMLGGGICEGRLGKKPDWAAQFCSRDLCCFLLGFEARRGRIILSMTDAKVKFARLYAVGNAATRGDCAEQALLRFLPPSGRI